MRRENILSVISSIIIINVGISFFEGNLFSEKKQLHEIWSDSCRPPAVTSYPAVMRIYWFSRSQRDFGSRRSYYCWIRIPPAYSELTGSETLTKSPYWLFCSHRFFICSPNPWNAPSSNLKQGQIVHKAATKEYLCTFSFWPSFWMKIIGPIRL